MDYREKFSAGGKFPGGYFKREGKPSEKEILTSRLCDRPLRPLFPKGFMNEVQVIGLLLATDQLHEPDILMVNAASAATLISDIPWNGPVGCVRVGQIDGEFVTNPNHDEMLDSDLDLIYVGSQTEMLMIEGSAEFISDERFYEALEYGQKAIQPIIAAQLELAKIAGKEKKDFPLIVTPQEIVDFCEEPAAAGVKLSTLTATPNASSRSKSSPRKLRSHSKQSLALKTSRVTTSLAPLMKFKRSFTAKISSKQASESTVAARPIFAL